MELSLQKHNVLGESPETRVDSPAESASPRPEEMSINTKRRMTLKKRLKKFVSKGKKSLSGLNFPQTKRSRSKTISRLLDNDLLSEEQPTVPPQPQEPLPRESPLEPTKVTWLATPLNHDQLISVVQPFLRRTEVASTLFSGCHYADMCEYLTEISGPLRTEPSNQRTEDRLRAQELLWKLTCKASKVEVQSNKLSQAASDINLYCRFGVLVRTHWDTMDKYDLNTFNRQEDVMFSSLVNATPGYESETVEFSKVGNLHLKVLVVEIWGRNRKRRSRSLRDRLSATTSDPMQSITSDPTQSLPSVQPLDERYIAPAFIGRACTSFQDTGIAGIELTLFSHSKKHEKGKLSVQLSFEVPQFDASIQEALEGYEVLFKAIVKHESQKEGDGCTRKWSAELSPVAKDLLLTYAKWYAIDTLQRIAIEIRLLLDYNQGYGVNIKAFYLLLEEVMRSKEEGVTDTPPDSDVISTNHEETKPDSSTNMTSSPSRDPTSPSSTRSEVTSPFSSEPLPLTDVPSKQRWQTFRSESESTAKEQEVVWPDELKQVLGLLRAYITEMLNKHLFIFDITKPEELEEYLKALKMLYTLHPIDDELRNFQTMLENCVKNGVQHWVSVCNAETQPQRQGSGYNAKSLKAQAEACNAKCKEVQEHIVDLFNRFGVDFFTIFIQIIGTKLMELSKHCISKEKSLPLDKDVNILYYQAYLTCRQIEKCASSINPSALEGLHIWRCYEHLVGSWIELASTMCKERIGKALAIDEVVDKVPDEVTYSSSAVDTNLFLHQMVCFWKSLDWPNVEQAFGYGLKHFENLGQCALQYVEMSYQQLSEKYLNDSEGRISVSERVCIFFNNVYQIKRQVGILSQKLEIKPVGQQSADRSLEVLKVNIDQTLEHEIQSCMEAIFEKLIPEIAQRLRSSDEHSIETALEEYLGSNLEILHENLLDDVFKTILQVIWKVTLQAIDKVIAEIKYDGNTLHKTLTFLKDFLGAALSKEELETSKYKAVLEALENRCLPTKDLVAKCCSELARQQQLARSSKTTCGELYISVGFTTDRALELNVIQAQVSSTHTDGSSDIFVYIWLLPQLVFTESAKKKHKTQVVKGTLQPSFCKEFMMPASKDCLKLEGSILTLGVYFTNSKHLAGVCVVPCSDIPILGEAGSSRSKLTLPMFILPELKGGPMGELAVRHTLQDTDATKFYKYLTMKLHMSLQP